MKWIEIKMRELGVSTHDGYKVTAFLDNTAMVTVHTAERGLPPRQMRTVLEHPTSLGCTASTSLGVHGHVTTWHAEMRACLLGLADATAVC